MWLNLPRAGRRWNARDRSLAEGLTVWEDSLNELGIPSWIARDPERHFAPEEIVDMSLAVLDETRDEMRRGGGDNYGVRIAVAETDRPRSPASRSADPERARSRDEALG